MCLALKLKMSYFLCISSVTLQPFVVHKVRNSIPTVACLESRLCPFMQPNEWSSLNYDKLLDVLFFSHILF